VPEVAHIVSRIGRLEIATDTTGPDESDVSDVYRFLKPKDQWRVPSKEDLIAEKPFGSLRFCWRVFAPSADHGHMKLRAGCFYPVAHN
jgi:hypothetical protein